jgi:DHA2 family multidrug resistance protein
MLATLSQQNYVNLSSHVSLLNSNTQAYYYSATSGMGAKMSESVGMAPSQDAALKALVGRVQGQAFMLSLGQLAWIIMIIFSLSFIPFYFLRLRVKPTGPVDSH